MGDLSWRAVLIAIIVLLVVYVGVVFVRIRRLKRKTEVVVPPGALIDSSAVAAYTAVQTGEAARSQPVPTASTPPAEAANSSFPWNEPPEQTPEQPKIEALEFEIGQLRKEIGGLRAELAVLKEEIRRDQSQAQVAQNVSPLYSDAMQMAMQGHDAVAISQHCGISRGEAELVVALARNQEL